LFEVKNKILRSVRKNAYFSSVLWILDSIFLILGNIKIEKT